MATEMANAMETEASGKAETENNIDKELMFEESTHGYLYNESNIWEKILSFYIIILQYALYFTFIIIGISEIEDDTTTINIERCSNLHSTTTPEEFVELVSCEDFNKVSQFSTITLVFSIIVLSKFLLFDMVEAIRGFKRNFIASILIIIEGFLAYIAGFSFIMDGRQTSSIDMLMGAVAVIFVHDIDEVVKKSVKKLPKNWCILVVPVVFVVAFFVVGLIFGQFWG